MPAGWDRLGHGGGGGRRPGGRDANGEGAAHVADAGRAACPQRPARKRGLVDPTRSPDQNTRVLMVKVFPRLWVHPRLCPFSFFFLFPAPRRRRGGRGGPCPARRRPPRAAAPARCPVPAVAPPRIRPRACVCVAAARRRGAPAAAVPAGGQRRPAVETAAPARRVRCGRVAQPVPLVCCCFPSPRRLCPVLPSPSRFHAPVRVFSALPPLPLPCSLEFSNVTPPSSAPACVSAVVLSLSLPFPPTRPARPPPCGS